MEKHSLLDYLILFTAGVLFLVLLKIFQGQRLVSFTLLVAFTTFYFLWGVFHHRGERTLHLKNVLEYIFIGFTVLILLTITISL